jgi:HAD superfamily hydrolase (TIGR01457 family)
MDISALREVRCFLLDMDGTFYLGDRLLPGSRPFMETLARRGTDFLFVTNNSSQNRAHYAAKLGRMGFPVAPERVFTSGEATALYLQRVCPGARIYPVGTLALLDDLASHGFTLTDTDPDAVVLGFDLTLTYEKLRRLCDLVRAGVPYYATHPDFNCPVDGGYIPDIGAMIAFVKASTGREPKVIGKPEPEMVQAVLAKTGLERHQLAMVGDRLYTDIAMGVKGGICSVLVLSGETTRADLDGSLIQPDFVFADLEELGAVL